MSDLSERLIPSKRQWGKWTLPSKYSALGLLFTVLSIVLSIVLYLRSQSPADHDEIALDGIRELLERTEERIESRLKSDYPLGYTMLYLSGARTVHTPPPPSPVEVNWATARVEEMREDELVFVQPGFFEPAQKTFMQGNMMRIKRVPGTRKPFCTVSGVSIWIEYIESAANGAVLVAGLNRKPTPSGLVYMAGPDE